MNARREGAEWPEAISPDLLHQVAPPEAKSGKDARRASDRITFGFARGTEEAELVRLALPALAPSTFELRSFERDLFLDELIDGCFKITLGGKSFDACREFLRKVLTEPPSARHDVEFRQAILSELRERPDLLRALEQAYVRLRGFRSALCDGAGPQSGTQSVRRRLDILLALDKAVMALGEPFQDAQSGLSRLAAAFGSPERYSPLLRMRQLIAFEDHRTELALQVKLGYDGTLRSLEIRGAEERAHPGFRRGPLQRFFGRLWALIKGYRFSEEDVMSALLDQVFSELEPLVFSLLRIATSFEFFLGSLGFSRLSEKQGLAVSLAHFVDDSAKEGSERALLDLFNPWLLSQGKRPVESQLGPGLAERTVILTGPNSGGKTRFLQAISVTQLLGQVGTFVPAREARLKWVDTLFLSLLERVSADQEEGRLGMELLRIRRVFETSAQSALIVMDELCSGTNPSEGEEIFEMVLDLLSDLRPQVFISTHFLDFAGRLEKSGREGLEFLQVDLRPSGVASYQFVKGVASTSMAQATAGRLGVTREELRALVERARGPVA